MVNLTLTVPEDLKNQMNKFPEINWSEVARQSISSKIHELLLVRSILLKSHMTEEDAEKIGDKIKSAIAEKHK